MNEPELSRFYDLIKTRLENIETENRLGHDSQSVVTLDQQSVGRLSRMDALQNQSMAKAQQTRRDTETARLQAALRRLKDNEFGYCDDCGDDIAIKRLELDPAAIKCISCASG